MRYCVTGDTLIVTSKGIMSMASISKDKESRINLKVLSYDGRINHASKFFNSGKHKTIKLVTKSGYSIEGSYNHPLLIWRIGQNFKPIISWKTLENFEEGDVVIIKRGGNLFSKKPLDLREHHPKKGFKNDVALPERMNNDLAFLLGALVSEGSFHNKQISFNNKDMKFYDKVKSIILSQFKGIQLYERKIKGACTELSIYEQKAVIFLQNIGLESSKSDKKEIPFSVLISSRENMKSFLEALFEGDGSVALVIDKRHGGKAIQLNYNSKSEILIKQIKTLLLNFGIVSSKPYKDKRNECFKLVISSCEGILRFHKELGFFSKRKKTTLKSIERINPSRLSKTDFVPFLNDYLRNKYASEFILRNNFDRYNSLTKNYSVLVRVIDHEDKCLIDWILKNRFYFDQINKVEKTETLKEVFSVKVDSKCHSFVANGFINHNTEARLSKIAEELLQDIEKETVKFVDNFDGSLKEPTVLPSKIPNLLINGSSGIAVGMATNIPPHNISEVSEGVIAAIDDPDITTEKLMCFVRGPDFPTGASILGLGGIKQAYETGRGSVIVRAKTAIEEKKERKNIIVNEIPYQVNKSIMIEQIAGLIRDKSLSGVSDLRDESDREGMRVVIELKKDANPEVILNQLYKHTSMQTTFGIIMLALVNNEPKVLSLKGMVQHFIKHRQDVVRKRTDFDLKEAEKKAHILEGLIIALNDIDNVIQKIKKSRDAAEAKIMLIGDYRLTEVQSLAILDMRLQRLASLEQEKIKNDHKELLRIIEELRAILLDEAKILGLIKNELIEIKNNYGDGRRTQIEESVADEICTEDLVKPEEMVVTMTHEGYIKRLSVDAYKLQKRGGHGVIGAGKKEEDFVEDLFIANTHSYILFFTNKGKVHWLKVYEIPEVSRIAKGTAVVNLLDLGKDEKVSAFVPIREFDDRHFIVFATKKGTVKKTNLAEYSRPRAGGIIAITLEEGDELINTSLTDGKQQIILATKNGLAVRFREEDVRATGRSAQGVRGARLRQNDEIVGMVIGDDSKTLLTVTENGYGKRTQISEYRLVSRGGVGVRNIICSERNGCVVAAKSVIDDDELIFISKNGIVLKTKASGISVIGRATQGMTIMKLEEGDKLVAAARIVKEENGNSENKQII
ncbi:MAG: DNA gyrase subunit A [Candidatus Woesearchaeota archaeon]|nr:DNA gyrase subunit A [Candidatus Woesearchaeota archaeon]